jgi:hypothetical protein
MMKATVYQSADPQWYVIISSVSIYHQKTIRVMMENSASIGMSDPIFGSLALRKCQPRTFETSAPVLTGRGLNVVTQKSSDIELSPSHSGLYANPLSSNIFVPGGSIRHVPTNSDYKRDLIIAQRELMNAHEEILKLEAELRAARYK